MADGTLKVGTITTSSGSGTITLGQSGETVDMSNATQTGVGGVNTPAFESYLNGSQSASDNSWTKIQINTEVFDTASAYDNSSNYRFTVPSGQGGKYFVYGMAQLYGTYDANDISRLSIYKNGSRVIGMSSDNRHDGTRVIPASVHTVMDLSASDYLELYALIDVSSGSPVIVGDADSTDGGNYGTRFGAYKIIE